MPAPLLSRAPRRKSIYHVFFTMPLAVRFPAESIAFQQLVTDGKLSPAANLSPPLHPVQLYEALGNLLLYFGLSLFALRKRCHGQVLVAYLLGYAALRLAHPLGCDILRPQRPLNRLKWRPLWGKCRHASCTLLGHRGNAGKPQERS